MSDMHVVRGSVDGKSWDVVMHFTTPGGNNSVAVPWATALVNSGVAQPSNLPDGDGTQGTIDATEKAAVLAGTVVEHRVTLLLETGGTTNAELRATLRAYYTSQKASVQAELQKQLRYFGHTESEV